jgi:hypothetical protein
VKRLSILPFVFLAALTLLGFYWFPGHAWLQQDTQIYVAILEHQWDPGLLASDPVATRPHVAFTIYDEAARALRGLCGLGFREVLQAQQILFRFVALYGVFLLGLACGLERARALALAALYGLGAVIYGPTVLTFEYEPVPRGFAVPLLIGAIGLAAHERWLASGLCAALAFLYHPPTVMPYWVCAALWWLVSHEKRERAQKLVPMLLAALLLFAATVLQTGPREPQELFARIDDPLAGLQQMRASYNWLSLWPPLWLRHYPLLFLFVFAAWWRLRATMTHALHWFSLALPLFGLVMMPVSWLLLEKFRWSLLPQYQPVRAVLFVTAFAVVLGGIAALRAQRWWERALWLLPVFLIPADPRLLQFFSTETWSQPFASTRASLALVLAIGCALALRWPRPALAAFLLPYLLFPTLGRVDNIPIVPTAALEELAGWARDHTARESVFLFPGAGRDPAPGMFRARALRSLYVDWKGGGQVNLLRKFAFEWWRRWQALGIPPYDPARLEAYRAAGIHYLVLKTPAGAPGAVFGNSVYTVLPVPAP